MNKIVEKRFLNADKTLFEMKVEAPLMARKARAGNFLMIRVSEEGERIPLTVADYDREKGLITIVVQIVGKTTLQLSQLEPGDMILDFIGPLGKNAHIEKYDDPVVVIGGGVGIAPVYPQAKEMKEAGNYVISIIGARNADLLFWEDKMRSVSDELIITTDDGSAGRKGFVTDALRDILKERKISRVIAIGPLIMMKFVAEMTRGTGDLPKVPTTVSLNPIMIDGTGMCGGCRFVTLDNRVLFACVDGPDVDGHNVNFDNLIARNSQFKEQEKLALERYKHKCKLEESIKNMEGS